MSDAVKPDTSEAAVERDAATVEHFARVWPEDAEESVRDAMRNSLVHISALLRTLLAERAALRAQLAEAREALRHCPDCGSVEGPCNDPRCSFTAHTRTIAAAIERLGAPGKPDAP